MRRIAFLIVAVMVGSLVLAGCSSSPTPPDKVINDYWQLVKAGDYEEAYKLIVEGREDEIGDMGLDVDELSEAIWSRFEMVADGYEIDGDVAIVNVTVTKPNLVDAMESYISKVFSELMAMAFDGASEEEIEQRAEELLLEAIDAVDDIVHQEKAELHLVDGEWKIYEWQFDNIESRMQQLDQMFDDFEDFD